MTRPGIEGMARVMFNRTLHGCDVGGHLREDLWQERRADFIAQATAVLDYQIAAVETEEREHRDPVFVNRCTDIANWLRAIREDEHE